VTSLIASILTAVQANTSGVDVKEVIARMEERHQKMRIMTMKNNLLKRQTMKYKKEDSQLKRVEVEELKSPVRPPLASGEEVYERKTTNSLVAAVK